MKVLILNSGKGSRMGDETKNHPKCMTKLLDETILSRQLKYIEESGLKEVIITTGKFADILVNYVKTLDLKLNIKYVHSDRYENTNYIYSMDLARDYLDDDIVLIHGDLVFSKEVFRSILNKKLSYMVTSSTVTLPEKDFKAVISNGYITKVGVEFFENAVTAQPLYRLNKKEWLIWREKIHEYCELNKVNCYAENALNEVSNECKIIPYDIKNELCTEIDSMEDLYRVRDYLNENEVRK